MALWGEGNTRQPQDWHQAEGEQGHTDMLRSRPGRASEGGWAGSPGNLNR